jgi:hypothetical protein
MNNFFEDLKKYFETTSQEKILEDWSKSEEFDKIGPTVEEFLINSQHYSVLSKDPLSGFLQNIYKQPKPEVLFGFSFL